MENKRNAMEERLNSTKPLDDLKEQESHLKQLNEEDEAIIQEKMLHHMIKKLHKNRLRLEMKNLCVCKRRLRTEKLRSLSKKESKRFSTKWCHSDCYCSCHRCHHWDCCWSHY